MSNRSILDYVNNVMSGIDAPADQKIQMENELFRHIMEASERTSVEEVKSSLCSPEKLAEDITKKLVAENSETKKTVYKAPVQTKHHKKRHYSRYTGEFMQERSNVNLKLLYIPLIQISSGTNRIVMPLTDDDDEDEDEED